MLNQFSRTQLLYGKEAMDKLKKYMAIYDTVFIVVINEESE